MTTIGTTRLGECSHCWMRREFQAASIAGIGSDEITHGQIINIDGKCMAAHKISGWESERSIW